MKNNTLKYRMGKVELKVDKVDEKMDKLLTNHIPHIERQIVALKTEVRILAALIGGAALISKLLT